MAIFGGVPLIFWGGFNDFGDFVFCWFWDWGFPRVLGGPGLWGERKFWEVSPYFGGFQGRGEGVFWGDFPYFGGAQDCRVFLG